MSERYNLTLGWDLTCNASTRRKYYLGMLGYLTFVGLIFIDGAYQISKRIKTVYEASSISAEFSGDLPSQKMEQLIQLGEIQSKQLEGLTTVAKPSIPFLPVFFELQRSLPEGVQIKSMNMDPKEVNLVFKCSSAIIAPETYLSQWRKNETLNGYLDTLRVMARNSGSDEDGSKWVELSCVATIR